jgi:hypothetical protein
MRERASASNPAVSISGEDDTAFTGAQAVQGKGKGTGAGAAGVIHGR